MPGIGAPEESVRHEGNSVLRLQELRDGGCSEEWS